MNTDPTIGQYLDEEEEALVQAIEDPKYKPRRQAVDAKRREALRNAAKATMNEERTRISLRVPKTDLARLKARAMQEGIPYQTLINSLLHKAVND